MPRLMSMTLPLQLRMLECQRVAAVQGSVVVIFFEAAKALWRVSPG